LQSHKAVQVVTRILHSDFIIFCYYWSFIRLITQRSQVRLRRGKLS